MKIYLDTSSLFKLYKSEPGSEEVEDILSGNELTGISLSEITKLEFISAVFKRVRMKDLDMNDAKQIIEFFERDIPRYTFVPLNSTLLDTARSLILKHGADGLRTLDALQLASAIAVKDIINRYLTSDKILKSLFVKEGLPG
ncbi:MAG: type II toxin-antitoxin system VapC family toxin [Ferruginibacter sp.]